MWRLALWTLSCFCRRWTSASVTDSDELPEANCSTPGAFVSSLGADSPEACLLLRNAVRFKELTAHWVWVSYRPFCLIQDSYWGHRDCFNSHWCPRNPSSGAKYATHPAGSVLFMSHFGNTLSSYISSNCPENSKGAPWKQNPNDFSEPLLCPPSLFLRFISTPN